MNFICHVTLNFHYFLFKKIDVSIYVTSYSGKYNIKRLMCQYILLAIHKWGQSRPLYMAVRLCMIRKYKLLKHYINSLEHLLKIIVVAFIFFDQVNLDTQW